MPGSMQENDKIKHYILEAMKVRYAIIYAALAVAFAAVSLWVALSKGRSARAVRAKFRLGGLMLTVSGMLTVTGCNTGIFSPTCYDPVAPELVTFALAEQSDVKPGDEIAFKVKDTVFKSYSYVITGTDCKEIQSGSFKLDGDEGKIIINETEYRGPLVLTVFGDADEEKLYLGSNNFNLK